MEKARTIRWFAALGATFAVAAAAAPDPALAQAPALEQGSVLVGGSAGFNIEDVEGQDEKTTAFHVSPTLQYFVGRGFALGGQVQLARSSRGDVSSTSYGIGPAATYYFVGERDVHPFLRGSVRIARSTTDSGAAESESDVFGFRAAGGLLVLLNQSVGVDASLYFDRSSFGEESDFDSDNYGLALGISAFVH